MNEIIITTSKNELGTSKLGKATAFIITSLNTDINNEKERAIKVHDVDANEWATKSNVLGEFDSTAKWAEKFFGWDKSKVSRYVRIVDKFHDDRKTDGNGADIWDDYTVSQMIELLKATDEQLQTITADMSVRAIREKLKMIDTDGDNTEQDENGDEQDNDEQDENNDEQNSENDVIDVQPSYIEYKRTTDITELAATIRQFKDVNVEYDNGEYIIYTKASE